MRRVLLPSGGEIVMEETEALFQLMLIQEVIKGIEKTEKTFILQANIEAAGRGLSSNETA